MKKSIKKKPWPRKSHAKYGPFCLSFTQFRLSITTSEYSIYSLQPRDRDKPPITTVEIQQKPETPKIDEKGETIQICKKDHQNEDDRTENGVDEVPKIEKIGEKIGDSLNKLTVRIHRLAVQLFTNFLWCSVFFYPCLGVHVNDDAKRFSGTVDWDCPYPFISLTLVNGTLCSLT